MLRDSKGTSYGVSGHFLSAGAVQKIERSVLQEMFYLADMDLNDAAVERSILIYSSNGVC
jgi:hypothetical protein